MEGPSVITQPKFGGEAGIYESLLQIT